MPFDVDVHTGYMIGYHVSENPNLSLDTLSNDLPFFVGPTPSEWFPSHLSDVEQSKYTVYKITADIKNIISFNQIKPHFSSPYYDLFINISDDGYEYRINPKYTDMLKALNIDMAVLIGTEELEEGLILSPASSIKTIVKEISNMSKPNIIVAFPGVGKTHIATSQIGMSVVDLDRPDLSQKSYTALLKQALAIEAVTHILLPSWPWLSDTLLQLGLDYTLVYPHPSLKSTYMDRYIQCGAPKSLIDTLDKNWDTLIESCVTRTATRKIVLTHPNEYLSDLLDDEIATYTLTIDDTDQ